MSNAKKLLDMLNTYHELPEVWDDKLDILRLEQELDIKKNPINKFPPRDAPYFSPSSANSCPRELYLKVKKAKRDQEKNQPYKKRWTSMGTAFGDMIQRDLEFIEQHYEKLTGETPAFIPERNENGQPFWEEFAKCSKKITHNGHTFYLFGTLDGKLLNTRTKKPCGLEIKTKQTTHAQTGTFKMKEDGSTLSQDHIKQITCYSIMYDLDDYVILYGNLSKKSWNMTEEEMEKYPDIRAFDVHIEDSHRQEVLDYFAYILDCVENDTPPPLDLEKFNFNSYKTACSLDLSEDELNELRQQVANIKRSGLPDYIKQNYIDALEVIEKVRFDHGK